MKKRGISLIVLIITIIVVIILAAVVILTISKNNPIESAKEATFKEDVRNFQHELAMYISKDYTARAGARDDKITATNYEQEGDSASVYTYIPSFKSKYNGKIIIKNDELMYSEDNLTEEEEKWCKDINIKANVKTGAEEVQSNPLKYYGKRVNYTSNEISDWKIFYSDGYNVYLITSEYIDINKLPETSNKKLKPENTVETYPKSAPLTNVISFQDYYGSSNITDPKIKALNNDYFKKGFSSTSTNMRAVAYLLDTKAWSTFAKGTGADYAIGAPTIEMLFKSYCNKYPDKDYRAQAINNSGYQISKDGGDNWSYGNDGVFLNLQDSLYVLNNTHGAYEMWIASPNSKYDDGVQLLLADTYGGIHWSDYNYSFAGFRPIVCLNSNVILTEGTDGYDYNISN